MIKIPEDLVKKIISTLRANGQITLADEVENYYRPKEAPITVPKWVDEWNRSGSDKYPV